MGGIPEIYTEGLLLGWSRYRRELVLVGLGVYRYKRIGLGSYGLDMSRYNWLVYIERLSVSLGLFGLV